MPSDPPGRYYVATLRGIGSLPRQEDPTPVVWNTNVAVESVDDALTRAARAGGEVLVGPVDAAPAGKVAAISDPTGATLCLWEARSRHGAQLVNEPSAWAMSALQTSDPDRAVEFYRELFGWQPEPFEMGPAQVTLWRLPGFIGGEPHQPVPRDVVAAVMPLPNGETPNWSVDFWIKDANAAAEKTPALGGQVLVAPHEVPGFRRAVLADPSGAAFSVSQLQIG